jgi:formamidopyrimidine-DNA glycosylase
VLTAGIAAAGSSLGGSSLQNYSRPGGQTGSFQEEHRVFRRTGQPCLTCGAPIERIVVGQRSTHFCPNCQPSEL